MDAATPGAITWKECPFETGRRISCGQITLPENRNEPDGRKVTLSFARIAAVSNAKTGDPVAFLTGGPGTSAFVMLKPLLSLSLGQARDIFVLEPRGYGYSEPSLRCPDVASLSVCYDDFKKAGIDVSQYTTEASVEDYEDLRRALGVKQWNLYGVSYGTYWASLYSRMHPEAIRAIIMDSPYPLNAGYDWNRVAFLNAFEQAANACRADEACNNAYPDIRARFIESLRKLKERPATFENETIDHIAAFKAIFLTSYISTTFRRTPKIVDALARGDYALFRKLAGTFFLEVPSGFDMERISSIGLNASVMCREDIFFPASAETRVAFVAPWPQDIVGMITPEGWDYDERCAAWPVEKSDPAINEPVSNDIPTLVLAGGYDPVTPREFAEAMMLHLSRATLAYDPSSAHALFFDMKPCMGEITSKFLEDPERKPDVSCLLRTAPVSWEAP